MSNNPKPRGRSANATGAASELTKLKAKWRELSDDTRHYWRSRFVSEDTQAMVRSELLKKFQINLRFDKQLTYFRDWVDAQDKLDAEGEQQIEDERRLVEEFGESWTLDQIREEVLKRSYARALATGDFASGRKTIVQDLNVKKVALDERKLVILEKKAAAFDAAKGVMGNKELTEAQKRQRMLELFGM